MNKSQVKFAHKSFEMWACDERQNSSKLASFCWILHNSNKNIDKRKRSEISWSVLRRKLFV